MNIIGIVMVRNEADIIRLSLMHHLSQGLDGILVIDNGSEDDTTEILARLSAEDPRILWRSDPGPYQQAAALTELTREACRLGADWVVPFDADEFWWVKGGDLRSRLARITEAALGAPVINFVQARDCVTATETALLTMTRRPARPVAAEPEWVVDGRIAFVEVRYPLKWAFRPTATAVVKAGSHGVTGIPSTWVVGSGIAILHAPLRGRNCLERKAEFGERALASGSPPAQSWHLKRWAKLKHTGELDREWAANSYSGTALDTPHGSRPLVTDDRLRDIVAPLLGHAPVQRPQDIQPRTDDPPPARRRRRVPPRQRHADGRTSGLEEQWHPKRLMVESANEGTLAFLKTTESRVIGEIGIYEGHTSRKIAEYLAGEGELHLFDFADRVDAVMAEINQAGFTNVVGFGNTRKLLDSYNWSLMRLIQKHDQPIYDYVFLDGGHVWALDAAAFFLIDRLLKPGGYIDFDDYHWSLAISPALNPAAFPMTAELYTAEQINERQIALVVDLLVRRDPRYEEVVANKIFRKNA